MIIIHKVDELLLDLFPKYKKSGGNLDILKEELSAFYTYGPFTPRISFEDGFVTIEIDTQRIVSEERDFERAMKLCQERRFTEAKKLLIELISKNPTNSEYHRNLGQVYSEEGNQEEAINELIDALKWNPKNAYAAIMMGNIFAKFKDDVETAKKYYNAAIDSNPKDFIAINNLGTTLIQAGKWDEGKQYLEKAHEINPKYPNNLYGLALANQQGGNTELAFDFAIECMKNCDKNNQNLFNHALSVAIKTAEELLDQETGNHIFESYKEILEEKSGKEIRLEKDGSIETAAKIEFAENHNRPYHLIKYQSEKKAVEHLMMHELVHLDFTTQAREAHDNRLFFSSGEHRRQFIKDHSKDIYRLNKEGFDEKSITHYVNALFEGMNRQIFNAPIDLFIEDFLYKNYSRLRPYQFISLYGILMEGKDAVTHKKATKLSPKDILKASRILNVVGALQFKELYGFDVISKFEANQLELKEADRLYEEFNEYRNDRKPGEEYELVQHWGEDFKFDKYFELLEEESFRDRVNPEKLIDDLQEDPFELESQSKQQEKNK